QRLIDAGAGADAALVSIESEQLSAVRSVAFTQGIGPALSQLNGPRLNALVTPLQANSTVPMVDIVEPNGRVLLAVRAKGAPEPVASRSGLRILGQAVRTANGPLGGRFTELVIFKSGPTIVTVSPIEVGNTPVGAVLAMTPLADALGRLSQELRVELNAYDPNGVPIASTANYTPKPLDKNTARSLVAGAAVVTRDVYADHREKLGRLIIEHTADAVLGVALEDDSNVTGRAVSAYVTVGLIATVLLLATFWARYTRERRRNREQGDEDDHEGGNGPGNGWGHAEWGKNGG
ncbi:MAG TPA: hypothetical protein VGT98_06045, partial [Candidatus Elarobacter sp.]|nr:hypothetical protein [Candidatus Elarobacter sp.]